MGSQKWVQDDYAHSGTREEALNGAPLSASKEHQKNLRNYGPGDSWYDLNITQERLKYHPELARSKASVPCPTVSKAKALPAKASAWSSPPPAPSAPPAVALPPGWEIGQAPGHPAGVMYYFNRATGKSQWEVPKVEAAQPVLSEVQEC